MNTETLELEPLELDLKDDAPAQMTAVVVLQDAALAPMVRMEATLRALAERYRNVAFDLKTTKGLDAAKAARLDLRENGRFAVQRARDKTKAELNDAKSSIEKKATELIAIVQKREDEIDADIKAREAELEAIKAEERRKAEEAAALKAKLEAERKQRHEDGISTLAGYVAKAQGKTSVELSRGIAFVQGIGMDPAYWEEYTERAKTTLAGTLAALNAQYEATLFREQEAERVQAQRRENERIAAELKKQAEELARQQAEMNRRAEEQRQAEERRQREEEEARAAEAAAAAAEASACAPEPEVVDVEYVENVVQANAEAVISVTEEHFADCSEAEGPHGDAGLSHDHVVTLTPPASEHSAIEPEVAEAEPATVKLGEICTLFGFTMTAVFIADTLGVPHRATEKAAKMYRESDVRLIGYALMAHISRVLNRPVV